MSRIHEELSPKEKKQFNRMEELLGAKKAAVIEFAEKRQEKELAGCLHTKSVHAVPEVVDDRDGQGVEQQGDIDKDDAIADSPREHLIPAVKKGRNEKRYDSLPEEKQHRQGSAIDTLFAKGGGKQAVQQQKNVNGEDHKAPPHHLGYGDATQKIGDEHERHGDGVNVNHDQQLAQHLAHEYSMRGDDGYARIVQLHDAALLDEGVAPAEYAYHHDGKAYHDLLDDKGDFPKLLQGSLLHGAVVHHDDQMHEQLREQEQRQRHQDALVVENLARLLYENWIQGSRFTRKKAQTFPLQYPTSDISISERTNQLFILFQKDDSFSGFV